MRYCLQECPTHQYYTISGQNYCADECNAFNWDDDLLLQQCYDNCSASQSNPLSLPLRHGGNTECIPQCPASHPFDQNGECVAKCDSDIYEGSERPKCVEGCTGFLAVVYAFSVTSNLCVANCTETPLAPFVTEEDGKRMCVTNCSGTRKFSNYSDSVCYEKCPSGVYEIVYADLTLPSRKITYKCLTKCPAEKPREVKIDG